MVRLIPGALLGGELRHASSDTVVRLIPGALLGSELRHASSDQVVRRVWCV